MAISFCRRLTQPIQERVHPAFEYWGHRDPTRGHERKVPQDEIANRVARIMVGQIRDKGCPKAHCPKRPTDAVSLLNPCRVVLIRSRLFPSALVGMYNNSALLQAKVLEYRSPTHLHEGDPRKDTAALAELRQPAEEEAKFSSDSSVGSESEVEITGASGPPTLAAPRRKTRRAVKKIPLSKAGLAAAQQSLRSSTRKGTSKVRGASVPPATAEVGSASAGP